MTRYTPIRVLVVAYYFNEENMGAIRLRRLVKYLARAGCATTILTAYPEHVLTGDLPGVRVERVRSLDFKAWLDRMRHGGRPAVGPVSKNARWTARLNRWLMIPDKQFPWRRPAIRRGRRLLREGTYDVIFASLEPRTNLMVAAALAKASGTPCVMEYRDLWTNNPHYHLRQPTRFHAWLHGRLEMRALAQANAVTATSRGILKDLERRGFVTKDRETDVVYNFFDPDEYPESRQTGDAKKGPFVILYAGAMYFARNPDVFLRGLRLFLDAHAIGPESLRFRWMGVVAAIPQIAHTLETLGLDRYVDYTGSVAHPEALAALARADVSLVLQAPEDTVHIPGKLFEAFGARTPVLAVSAPCELTELVERVHGGVHVPHDPDAVSRALTELWTHRQTGEPWPFREEELASFQAERMTDRLMAVFNRVRREA